MRLFLLTLLFSTLSLTAQNWQIIDSTSTHDINSFDNFSSFENNLVIANHVTWYNLIDGEKKYYDSVGVYLSTDKGDTWNKKHIAAWNLGEPPEKLPSSVQAHIINENTIICIDNYGHRITSHDLGDSWVKKKVVTSFYEHGKVYGDLKFNGDDGITTYGGYPDIYLTDNGGESWTTVSTPSGTYYKSDDEEFDYSFYPIRGFKFGNRIILNNVSGERGKSATVISEDNGQSWTQIIHEENNNSPYNLYMYDKNLGFRYGNKRYRIAGIPEDERDKKASIMRTKDGGYTWEEVFILLDKDREITLNLAHAVNKNTIVVSNARDFFKSFDGGNTWEEENVLNHFDKTDIAIVSITSIGSDVFLGSTTSYIIKGNLMKLSVEEDKHILLNITPNPLNENGKIIFQARRGQDISLTISNSAGDIIDCNYSINYENDNAVLDLNTKKLITGAYFARVKIGNKTFTSKFVKQ